MDSVVEKLSEIEKTAEDIVEYKLDAIIYPSNATLILKTSNISKIFVMFEFIKIVNYKIKVILIESLFYKECILIRRRTRSKQIEESA